MGAKDATPDHHLQRPNRTQQDPSTSNQGFIVGVSVALHPSTAGASYMLAIKSSTSAASAFISSEPQGFFRNPMKTGNSPFGTNKSVTSKVLFSSWWEGRCLCFLHPWLTTSITSLHHQSVCVLGKFGCNFLLESKHQLSVIPVPSPIEGALTPDNTGRNKTYPGSPENLPKPFQILCHLVWNDEHATVAGQLVEEDCPGIASWNCHGPASSSCRNKFSCVHSLPRGSYEPTN